MGLKSIKKPHIIIIGAGFAGLNLAMKLKGLAEIKITIIDSKNYHVFQPFLYQVACADLAPSDIALPIRDQFKGHKNITVIMDKVVIVDKINQTIYTQGKLKFFYDFLVIATGSSVNYFNEKWKDYIIGLKSIEDALLIKNKILSSLEHAEATEDSSYQKYLSTFVIIGGGPTGVELAGSIAELLKQTLKSNFTKIDPTASTIILIEAEPQLLPSFPATLGQYTLSSLENKGITVKLNTRVQDINKHHITLFNGEIIKASLIIWGAGVRVNSIKELLGEDIKFGSLGKAKVEDNLSLPGTPNIFIIGDACEVIDHNNKPLPGLAAVATQQGKFLAQVLKAHIRGSKFQPKFVYKDYGNLAIIGRYAAVADFKAFKLKGKVAWLIWDIVHIYFLIGFRNRLIVFVKWMWNYITHNKSERIIL